MTNIKSICMVRLSALGDVLMFVPLVRTLQNAYPDAKLTWIISRPAYDLVEHIDGVEFIVITKPQTMLDYLRFKRQLADRKFDVLLAAQASLRANLLYACIRAKRKIGYDKLRAKDLHKLFVHEQILPGRDHTLDGFLKFANHLGVTTTDVRWDIPITQENYKWAQSHVLNGVGPLVIINPAASKSERSWLLERYIAVIQYVQQRFAARVILTGGPSDLAFGDAILQQCVVCDLIGKTKPAQLLALIQQADLVLCPDTGPSHMAAAVNTPVIALHAVTSSAVSGPYQFRHLAVDFYPIAVEKILKTTIEKNVWGTHAHGSETMKLIPVDAVIAQIDLVLGLCNLN